VNIKWYHFTQDVINIIISKLCNEQQVTALRMRGMAMLFPCGAWAAASNLVVVVAVSNSLNRNDSRPD